MSHPALRTAFCELVGVDHPIVQTGMGWVAGPRLVSATANAGALGILAGATMTADEFAAAIREVKERTDKPFGVNMRGDQPDAVRPGRRDDPRGRAGGELRPGAVGAADRAAQGRRARRDADDRGASATPRRSPRSASTRSSPRAARAAVTPAPSPPACCSRRSTETVDVPVIGAGGFFDGRGLVAALAYGAAGIAMGTRFLLTQESTVPDAVKAEYLKTPVTGTVVTTRIDGYPQRVIRTKFVDHLERTGRLMAYPRAALQRAQVPEADRHDHVATCSPRARRCAKTRASPGSQVALAANAPMLTKATMVDGDVEVGILPDRPGRRRDRGAADGGRADPADHGRGRRRARTPGRRRRDA